MPHPDSHKEPSHKSENDVFELARENTRKRLGEFADIYMQAKILYVTKLFDKIGESNDLVELKSLQAELNNALYSPEDIAQLDQKIGALLSMFKNHLSSFIEIAQEWSSAKNGHGGYSHGPLKSDHDHVPRQPRHNQGKSGHGEHH